VPTDVTLVQFLGHDNSFYNAVLHTAVALALGDSWPLPEHVIANEFYFLGASKFSTSRNHTVSGREAVALVGPDCLRFHLARTNPERWQTSFSRRALLETAELEIDGAWTAAVESLGCLAQRGSAPPDAPASDLRVRGLLEAARIDLERSYGLDEFSLRRAGSVLLDLAVAGRDFAQRAFESSQGPGPNNDCADAAAFLRGLALLSAPLLPELAQAAWKTLGAPGEVADAPWPTALVGLG
jgi:methionyl-tRNA synthetase